MAREKQRTDPQVERAARNVGDPDRLLPGEGTAISSEYVDDAVSWRITYEELFAFKQKLLSTLLDQRASVRPEGRDEVQNDEILLTREADRLARRLEFWKHEVAKRARRPS